jgi:translation elongation factor EF-G
MPRVLSGVGDPDDSGRHDPELAICITVPEEFAGWSMAELNGRRGYITEIVAERGNALIRGVVPTSQYAVLGDVIAAGTRSLGRIERAESGSE